MAFMKTLQGFFGDIGHWFKIRHYQYLCMAVIVSVIGTLMREGPTDDTTTNNNSVVTSQHFSGMVHVGSFAACLGAQLWVIFVAGMTMFLILPRHMFGKLQTFLFPMFFLWCLAFSGMTLSTFSSLYPHHSWDRAHITQMVCLFISFTMASINSIILSPLILESMGKTFQLEVGVGAGHIVGHAVIKELLENPEYVRSYRNFRRCHGVSGLLNVISLVANFVYLNYLVSRLDFNESVG